MKLIVDQNLRFNPQMTDFKQVFYDVAIVNDKLASIQIMTHTQSGLSDRVIMLN